MLHEKTLITDLLSQVHPLSAVRLVAELLQFHCFIAYFIFIFIYSVSAGLCYACGENAVFSSLGYYVPFEC